MKNHLLAISRRSIPYLPDLRPITGSVTATILMQQLDYWFSQKPEGFYKFLSPCNHEQYKQGDSWEEEIGFSTDEFRTAFDRIGVRHTSKTSYKIAAESGKEFISGDKTQTEKFYASYHDRTKGLTYYFRNHHLVDLTLERLCRASFYVDRESPVTGNGESPVTSNKEKPSYGNGESPVTFLYTEITQETTTKTTSPLTPQGEERHALANGDSGSKEPTPQPLEEEVVSEHQSQANPTSWVDVNQSESKEVFTARDNKTIDTQSSAYKMEQRFKSRTKAYPKYRTSSGVNGIKTEFLQWLQTSYLPTIQYYQGKKIEIVDAKTWVSNKENAGHQELLEARYEQMLSKQSAQVATQIKQLALTPEEEAWVAIVREIQMVSEGAYVNVTACSEFWLVTTNIAGLSGKLADAIASTPLTDLPVKFKTWYPECYRRAKRKFPQLTFPAPLEPQERAS